MNRAQLWKFQSRAAPYLFVLPFALLFCVFLCYPLGRSFYLSLHKTIGPRHAVFVGFDNYRFLLHQKAFWAAVANTSAFTFFHTLLSVVASLLLALLLNRESLRLRNLFRFAFFSTSLVGGAFTAVLFALLLEKRNGLLNRLLNELAGLIARAIAFVTGWHITHRAIQIPWLENPRLTLVSLIIASLWLSIGFGMIYLLAALSAVDRELYDSAAVDGAGRWSRFWHVTLPSIKPVLVFLVLINVIAGFQLFDLPWILYQGAGPNHSATTIAMYLYIAAFGAGDLGYASAIGWVLAAILFGVTVAQLRVTGIGKEER